MKTPSRYGYHLLATVIAGSVLGLSGCFSSSGSDSSTVTVQGDVPLAYVKRSSALMANPTNGAPFAAGGDLMIREKSSPSAPEHNVTAQFTRDAAGVANGDVSDPEASYDAKKIVFSMRCPATNPATIGGAPACTGHWNIWEYDMTSGGMTAGTFKRITASTTDDDVDPAYLPGGGGFVFSSNRQEKTRTAGPNGTFIYAVDEYERERVLNLHTMAADGTNITQISVNQSHDRNPVVMDDGHIMFSRWEHVGPRNRFAVFKVNPDGTGMFVHYGAQSPGNSFLHPREMDPKGKYSGQLTSSLMSLSGTREGGALMIVDAKQYSEANTPINPSVAAIGGQKQMTAQAINDGRGLSLYGRITSPFPLWDGTDRVLISYMPCQVMRAGTPVLCATLTSAEVTRLSTERTMVEEAADELQDNAPPNYAVYMYDPATQSQVIVAAPPAGFMYTDPIALQARAEPNVIPPALLDDNLKVQNLATLEVRSVYDTDGLGRMSEGMLAASDLAAGCTTGIAMTAATDPTDTRSSVADLTRIKDPANAAYRCAPARFVRATRAVAPTAGTTGMREAIGETDFEPQQILGYAAIEPDGSFRLQVPADTPLALSVLDAKGRSIQTHLNWIQVRPGERRTCDGCHSPRRGASLNSTTQTQALPAAVLPGMKTGFVAGRTMAFQLSQLQPSAMSLLADPAFTDRWADTSVAGVTAKSSIALRYTGNTDANGVATPAEDLATPAPVNGIINYPQHIQPIWARARPGGSCVSCHTDPTALSLQPSIGGTGRMTSYDELLLGDPVIGANGQPVTRLEDGVPVIVRGAALVETMAGGATGLARSSRLAEILFGETLKAGAEALAAHPTPTTVNHATMLNTAEKRLVTEWMDLGGQYYNDLSASGAVRTVTSNLSQASFATQVLPTLQANCVGCHTPGGNSGASQTTNSFVRNRDILTGDVEGDYNVTLTMISDTCTPANNALLRRPSTVPHPSGATGQATAVLPAGSTGYSAISAWILRGCPTP